MVGIIVSGHGNFADGIKSGIELISGNIENIKFFNFTQEKSSDDADIFYKDAISSFKERKIDKTVILTDLAGGTPFNRAVTVSLGYDNVFVFSGANMAMVLSAVNGCEELEDNIDEFIRVIIEEGKSGVNVFSLN